MLPPPIPSSESERLEALERYEILDTLREEAFDDLALLALTICDTPIALITLVDAKRQWFKARIGLELSETPRDLAICAHAMLEPDVFIVHDTHRDPRFHDNPLAVGAPHVRFYAGAPLITPDGHPLGTICVIDHVPRELTERQQSALRALARQIIVELELRRTINEKKRVERELGRFFDLSIDLLCIAGTDGFFRRINPAFETILGYRRDEMLARPILDFVHPDDWERTIAEMERLRAGIPTVRFMNRYLSRDGTTRWFAWTASPVPAENVVYAAARDITDAKLAEAALRESEARTRSIIDSSPVGLITADFNGAIESVNAAAELMFGCTSTELTGRPLTSLVRDGVGQKANGETFPCEVSTFAFEYGGECHIATHVIDVTERHAVDRLKNEFVATVSHELRTPLTSIHGALGLLAARVAGELPDEARELVAVAERNSSRLMNLINDILDFEKLESGRVEMDLRTTPLSRILDRAIEQIGAFAAQERVRIEVDCVPASLRADENRLTQVMVNLLSNAVKFSPRGGVVTVTAAPLGNGSVEIRVRDRGRGITPQAQPRLFQRFQQIESSDSRPSGGTGLGLAICRTIVEQHGGTIGVESGDGEGSTFWVRVPGTGEKVVA